jgi:hypothetical protein
MRLAYGIFGVDDTIMGRIECYWWKFWRRLWALPEQLQQLPRLVALAGGFLFLFLNNRRILQLQKRMKIQPTVGTCG